MPGYGIVGAQEAVTSRLGFSPDSGGLAVCAYDHWLTMALMPHIVHPDVSSTSRVGCLAHHGLRAISETTWLTGTRPGRKAAVLISVMASYCITDACIPQPPTFHECLVMAT